MNASKLFNVLVVGSAALTAGAAACGGDDPEPAPTAGSGAAGSAGGGPAAGAGGAGAAGATAGAAGSATAGAAGAAAGAAGSATAGAAGAGGATTTACAAECATQQVTADGNCVGFPCCWESQACCTPCCAK